jgi:membrane protein implicated in regulation of membrane protease activity
MDKLQAFLEPQYLWLIAGVVMIILEFMLPGIVIIFFGVGAILVGLTCWIWAISFNEQLILFMIASVVLLLSLRRWVKNIFVGYTSSPKELGELTKEFVGQRAVVAQAIEMGRRGKVELHGVEWEAEADEAIGEGAMVTIVGQDGIVLKVK